MTPEERREYHRRWRAAHPGYDKRSYEKRKNNPEYKEKKKQCDKLWAQRNKRKRTSDKHAKKVRQFLNSIKEHYGCLNPSCLWRGKLKGCCLDFHHIVREEKKISLGCSRASKKRLVEEINKCTVLCAICHRMTTWAGLDASSFKKCCIDTEGNCD